MAKWVKLQTSTGYTYFNLDLIRFFQIRKVQNAVNDDYNKFDVVIDTLVTLATFDTKEEADKFIKEFIAEHYIQTEKVE